MPWQLGKLLYHGVSKGLGYGNIGSVSGVTNFVLEQVPYM